MPTLRYVGSRAARIVVVLPDASLGSRVKAVLDRLPPAGK
jgi:hypothetical protein